MPQYGELALLHIFIFLIQCTCTKMCYRLKPRVYTLLKHSSVRLALEATVLIFSMISLIGLNKKKQVHRNVDVFR